MNKRFSDRFSSQWVKVRFYNKKPGSNGAVYPSQIRFCEALKSAITKPIIIDKKNLSCESAKYAFGWRMSIDQSISARCIKRRGISDDVLKSLFSTVPRFEKPFGCIGLNTDGEPDMVIARIAPKEMMEIVKIYNNYIGKELKLSLNSVCGICGNVAVKTFLNAKINISFGCVDSRKYGDMDRDRFIVGVPKALFKLFI